MPVSHTGVRRRPLLQGQEFRPRDVLEDSRYSYSGWNQSAVQLAASASIRPHDRHYHF